MTQTLPAYRQLLEAGQFQERIRDFREILASCDLCPRECHVNRLAAEKGLCGVAETAWVSSFGPHLGEENPLRGWRGSGTIFFSGCNLSCLYCQNSDISQRLSGRPVSAEELAGMMLDLQLSGCHNINLVSPSHVMAQIAEGIYLAAIQGLSLPIVYNTGGYDSLKTLSLLDGMIDIYMPDMKYSSADVGKTYSDVQSYPEVNQAAVKEMHHQVGDLLLDQNGIAIRGLLIRHLVLPGDLAGSKKTLEFIANEISLGTYLNIMDQYRPAYQAHRSDEINRRITADEYQEVVDQALALGLTRLDSR
jgi:putative pyruvate formate lyase activating enzyme